MKTLAKKSIKYIGAICLGIAVMATSSFNSAYAQGKSYTKQAETLDAAAPKNLQVAVFQVDNTLKFKMHLANQSKKNVTIKIKNSDNKVIYTETVSSPKYIRKFDFNTLADGNYTFEVSNRKETFVKEVTLQTLSARSLNISE